MTTSIFYPVKEGSIAKAGSVWSTTRSATTGDSVLISTSENFITAYKSTSYSIDRAFLCFDTASIIPDGSIIQSASLNYAFINTYGENDGNVKLTTVSATFARDGVITTADFNDFGTTELSDRVLPDFNYFTFTLNSSGFAEIIKTGTDYTVIGVISELDFDNTTPIIDTLGTSLRMKTNASSSLRPYLTVTYKEAVLKRWNSSAWVPCNLKRYNGASFVATNLKYYDGANWKEVDTQG